MEFVNLDRMPLYQQGYAEENCKELIRKCDILKAYVRFENEKWSCCVVVLDPDSGDKRDYFVPGKRFTKEEAEKLLGVLHKELQ